MPRDGDGIMQKTLEDQATAAVDELAYQFEQDFAEMSLQPSVQDRATAFRAASRKVIREAHDAAQRNQTPMGRSDEIGAGILAKARESLLASKATGGRTYFKVALDSEAKAAFVAATAAQLPTAGNRGLAAVAAAQSVLTKAFVAAAASWREKQEHQADVKDQASALASALGGSIARAGPSTGAGGGNDAGGGSARAAAKRPRQAQGQQSEARSFRDPDGNEINWCHQFRACVCPTSTCIPDAP